MNAVQVEQKSYEMPPRDGFTVTHFITVADIDRSARFYEKVFGGRILGRGDSKGASGHIQIANTWLIFNVGGGPTPDKPTVTLSVPADPDKVSSFINIRVADIQACYELWKSRGAEFLTEPIAKYGEIRCYIRDPDGYIIEVGQTTDLTKRAQQSQVRPHQLGQDVFRAILSEDIDWKPFPAFPPSVRLAVVVGKPSDAGPYTIRVKVPHGVKLMPHKHPEDRVYTVISGVFYIGLGDEFDASKLEAYPPGAVIILPGNTAHFHWAKSGEYVTQVTAIGPLGLEYLSAKDDPRNNNS
jgi:catechol 2,3-dioxygenase-like lactoylglutathione lyase family enzyme/quercetin dioxygenase-like cupin family protein